MCEPTFAHRPHPNHFADPEASGFSNIFKALESFAGALSTGDTFDISCLQAQFSEGWLDCKFQDDWPDWEDYLVQFNRVDLLVIKAAIEASLPEAVRSTSDLYSREVLIVIDGLLQAGEHELHESVT